MGCLNTLAFAHRLSAALLKISACTGLTAGCTHMACKYRLQKGRDMHACLSAVDAEGYHANQQMQTRNCASLQTVQQKQVSFLSISPMSSSVMQLIRVVRWL